jgi:small subunit ribosomal protein S4e
MINKTKRQMIPRVVKIPRKMYFWGATSAAGPHKKNASVPLLHILRDYLSIGEKEREITRILNNKFISVDGKVIKEKKYPAGFMDLISIKEQKSSYRVLYDRLGRLVLIPEKDENSNIKPRKVLNKFTVKGGKTMIVCHDGYNYLTESKAISTGDVLIFNTKDKKIDGTIKLQEGSRVFLTGGNHVGSIATVKGIDISKSSESNLISMEEGFATIEEYVFPIGNLKFNLVDIKVGESQ